MKDNVSYQKTDFGAESPDLSEFVLKTLKIAGIALKRDITVEELQKALSVPSKVSQLINDLEFINKETFDEETNARLQQDKELQDSIDNLLYDIEEIHKSLIKEEGERRTNDNIMLGHIEMLLAIAHTHHNKEILDTITDEKIKIWDSILEFDNQIDMSDYKHYINQILYGNINQFRDIYSALGVRQYDGGLFGMEYEGGAHLDGGSFNDTEIRQIVDEGDFTPRSVVPPLTERVTELETMFGLLESELDKINGEEI